MFGKITTALGGIWLSYVSPYCIVYALAMILYFSKITLSSKWVNWLGASSFAVFLIHTNPNTLYHFKSYFLELYQSTHYSVFWVLTFGVLLLVFLVAVLIDQVRLALWNRIWNFVND